MKKIIVIFIVLVLVVGVGVYVAKQSPKEVENLAGDDVFITNGVAPADFERVIAMAPSIELDNVDGSGARATAWLAVYEGKTYHRVVATNMAALPGTDFYEGWLVKNPVPGGFFSTGKMAYNPDTKEAKLDFVTEGDQSAYSLVVITSEPDDNNPAPDKHIVEKRFPDQSALIISKSSDAPTTQAMPVPGNEDVTEMVVETTSGSYEVYAPEKLAKATNGKVVLFFKASWCPTCKALDADIRANMANIPAGVTILEVDYDKYTDLKKKYNVTYQHTMVQVDASGTQVKKWSGSPTLDSIIGQI